MKDTAERMGAATSSVALCAITSCSAAISDRWRIQLMRNNYRFTQQARLWAALCGLPSIMKTPIISETTAPLVSLDMVSRDAWNTAMADYKVRFAAWKAVRKNPEPPPTPPRLGRHVIEKLHDGGAVRSVARRKRSEWPEGSLRSARCCVGRTSYRK